MATLVLAPHGDDETLFASYICQRNRAHVIVCTQDANPEIRQQRSFETNAAISELGCSHQEWPMPASAFDYDQAKRWLEVWASTAHVAEIPDKVYAPAISPEGHEQHNEVGHLAIQVFGDSVIPYMTYAPRGQRQTGVEVIPTPTEIQRKLRALACYGSQIGNHLTRPWFYELLDMREWLGG